VATFSVARNVRDQLSNNGFALQKIPGFASKRDMLTARYQTPAEKQNARVNLRGIAENKSALAPCYYRFCSKHFYDRRLSKKNTTLNQQEQQPAKKTALVIGAGIAGCSIAYKLAKENWQVELVVTADTIAAAASGNSRAVLYARTAKQRSSLADFHEAAFHYAVNFYSGFYSELNSGFNSESNKTFGLNGMLKLDEKISEQLLAANPELRSRQNVDAEQAKQLAGIDTHDEGIFYPQSGWLDPVAICTQLTAEKNIRFHGNTVINQLMKSQAGWQADVKNQSSFNADIIVIACGQHSNQFTQSQWLPLKSLRGQTTELPSSESSKLLNIAVCQQGYITPQQNGLHSIGATYSPDNDKQILTADHKQNIDNLMGMLDDRSDWKAALGENRNNLADEINGRVGFRCVSPDYMPIVGPLLNDQVFNQQFNHLSKDASKTPDTMAKLHDGLFVSTGFGSHGFTTAPLAAELLLAQIEGTPMPLGDKLRQSIAPIRFLTRQLVRGKSAAKAKTHG
jgi:tRNA 5-methylaminomethyl-2-thiouridine biosynthesis bifunctional protein